jgi:phospholipid/cholesterol/gamma-HCH transport system permease protein
MLQDIGGVSILTWNLLSALPRGMSRGHLVFQQMLYMGVNSLPLVFLTSLFTGAVTSVQAAYQFTDLLSMRYLGSAVSKAVIIELGPVLTALVVTGRVGAAIAAELGTMKVTEQIDALETMALNPTEYLVVPRFIGGLIMLPVLTIFADLIAILGGLVVAIAFLDVTSHTFLVSVKSFFEMTDFWAGITKSFAFGAIIAVIGCYQGFNTSGGAEGVGRSTTKAVVVASVLILISDYFLASIIFGA